MNELRLDLYLEQIEIAAHRTMEFVDHQTRDEFLADVKTQHAVAMSIAVMGEAATKISNLYTDFIANSPDIKLAGNTWYAAPHRARIFQY